MMKKMIHFAFVCALSFSSCKQSEHSRRSDDPLKWSSNEMHQAVNSFLHDWPNAPPLTDEKLRACSTKLKSVKFPTDIDKVCDQIGLDSIHLSGRYVERKDPPFVWSTAEGFHTNWTLRYKTKPDRYPKVYDFQIIRKEREEDL